MVETGNGRIRVAIAGVGNCASSLVQAVSAAVAGAGQLGVAHPSFGGYGVGDIAFVAAFDVDDRKVGADLSAAIASPPNCTSRYVEVPYAGVRVACGPLGDGLGPLTQ